MCFSNNPLITEPVGTRFLNVLNFLCVGNAAAVMLREQRESNEYKIDSDKTSSRRRHQRLLLLRGPLQNVGWRLKAAGQRLRANRVGDAICKNISTADYFI